ncbi:MAG: SpoIIE family protein phosphatase [Pirellulales bacterium]|nr:SpoIIE family protein phosphatase [Pirellulales bacterium]
MTLDNPSATLSNEELRGRLDGLTRLLDVTRSMAAEVDSTAMLESITRSARRALDCERASLFQYDPQTRELYTRFATELEIREIRHPVDLGVTGAVARCREIANIPDPTLDLRWQSGFDQKTGFHTRNILAAPLISQHDQSLLGVLECLNKRDRAFDRFDEQLVEAFSQHATAALDRVRILESARQRQAVEFSLNTAREIQQGFMPSNLPDVPGYELAMWWHPNEAIGGDYCDLIVREDELYLVIADVSGHGLGPSLLMASVRSALRALIIEHPTPDDLLTRLNMAVSPDLPEGKFVTIVVARLDLKTQRLEFSNAGHAPALHYLAATDAFDSLEATGVPLGVLETVDYPMGNDRTIEVDDLILFCTDGIVEVMNADDQTFGLDQLLAIVRQNRHRSMQEIVKEIATAVSNHFQGSNPSDDLTVIAAKRVN